MRWWFALVAISISACSPASGDHERLGDIAYGKGLYEEALAEYRAAVTGTPEARVYAKLGLAAVKAQHLREAGDAYRHLAVQDPSRQTEAALGLDRVARAAGRSGDGTALKEAVTALRAVAPSRVSGLSALGLARSEKLTAPEALAVLPAALAVAPDAGAVDSLLVAYGKASRETTACEEAAHAFQAALRRTRNPKLRSASASGLAECGLQLGTEALTLEKPAVAARWFSAAVAADSSSDAGRRSLIGLGDARIAQGDLFAAALAFQGAIARDTAGDSISHVAILRLNGLGAAQEPPTPTPPRPIP